MGEEGANQFQGEGAKSNPCSREINQVTTAYIAQ